ncbi:MAG: (d)CMP kinase, partial [Oscillospiraceae bacterium]
KIIEILPQIDIKIRFVEGEQHVILNGEDVSEEIRLPEISMAASNVSSIPEVREFLLEFQHKLARENNVLMDGRDIGTVILPNADVKIFLTASAEERANRRFKQLSEKPDCPTYEDILNDIIKRDYNDSHRAAAPLKQADDAVLIDSSSMNILETIEKISEVINQKLGGAK